MNKTITNKAVAVLATILSLFTSCTNDIEDMTQIDAQKPQQQSIRMTLDVARTGFDAPENGDTRAASVEWKDGDVMYLRFHTGNGLVTGNATYNATEQDWTVNYFGTLARDVESKVEVSFFDGVPLAEGNEVSLSQDNGIYQDMHGVYFYSSDRTLRIKAELKPTTSRIRFKGERGTSIRVNGLQYYSKYDVNTGVFTTDEGGFSTYEVEDNGYTKYIYAIRPTTGNPQLKVNRQNDDGWRYLYTLACTPNILAIGKSGWMDIPTETNRNGWSMKQVSGEENGHMWVDLGLPSGVKWADVNIGADIAQWLDGGDLFDLIGVRFRFGETSPSTYYKWDDDIQGTWIDTALYKWGGKWCMPSKQDFRELIDYCSIRGVECYYGLDDSGLVFMGQTGEEIFFPEENQVTALYWSSTPAPDYRQYCHLHEKSEDRECAYALLVSNTYWYLGKEDRRNIDHNSYGYAQVRAIIK